MNKRVLIAEDEPHIVESLSFVLQRKGYEVEAVFDGETALAQLRNHRPDVMILDVMLPRVNGFEVLKQVKSDAALQSVPVIILTAKGQAQDRRMAEEIGVDGFMTKPFSNQEIIDEVGRLTGRQGSCD